MASSLADQGLVTLWQNAISDQRASEWPNTANLVVAPFTPGPALSKADLTWLDTADGEMILTGWVFTLDSSAHQATGTIAVTWVLSSALAGQTLYGVGLYDGLSDQLFYTETFPVPYTVPTGGGSFYWTFNLKFGDCAFSG